MAAQGRGVPKLIRSTDWYGGGLVTFRTSVAAVISQGTSPTFGKAIGRGRLHSRTKCARDEVTDGRRSPGTSGRVLGFTTRRVRAVSAVALEGTEFASLPGGATRGGDLEQRE